MRIKDGPPFKPTRLMGIGMMHERELEKSSKAPSSILDEKFFSVSHPSRRDKHGSVLQDSPVCASAKRLRLAGLLERRGERVCLGLIAAFFTHRQYFCTDTTNPRPLLISRELSSGEAATTSTNQDAGPSQQPSWEAHWTFRAPGEVTTMSARTSRLASWDAAPSIHASPPQASVLTTISSPSRSIPMPMIRSGDRIAWTPDTSGTSVETPRHHFWDAAPRTHACQPAVRVTNSGLRV